MKDVWELIIENSSLITGDVWEHLNAQTGGGGEVLVEAIRSADILSATSASCDTEIHTAGIIDVLAVDIIDEIHTTDVADDVLTADYISEV